MPYFSIFATAKCLLWHKKMTIINCNCGLVLPTELAIPKTNSRDVHLHKISMSALVYKCLSSKINCLAKKQVGFMTEFENVNLTACVSLSNAEHTFFQICTQEKKTNLMNRV